jgi:hypothetical protein
VLRRSGYRFFFFSLEGHEPPHIHVEQAERYARIWLTPVVLARARGFRNSEISEMMAIVRENRELLQQKWHEHFGR